MKFNEDKIEVLSNVTSEKTNFSVSDNVADQKLLFDIITKKSYKYHLRSPVQEYICNARDAHRQIKQTRPFEITAPTFFDPVFKVRDFGPGISPEMMLSVFVKFFASTKRRDNSQTGGFGLGAKSAWAYSDSFQIISIVDGIKRSYTAYKTGEGILQQESEEKTTEPAGLEIIIPIKPQDVKTCENAIKRAIYFWKESERPVVCNFKMEFPKTPIKYDRMAFYSKEEANYALGDQSYSNRYESDAIILDGIVYEMSGEDFKAVDLPQLKSYDRKVRSFFLICETGELSVTPFRENLQFDEHTIKTLTTIIPRSLNAIQSKFDKDFNSFKSLNSIKEKVEVIKKYENILKFGDVKLSDNFVYKPYHGGMSSISFHQKVSSWNKMSFMSYSSGKERMRQLVNTQFCSDDQVVSHIIYPAGNYFVFDSTIDKDSELKARKKMIQHVTKNSLKNVYFIKFGPESSEERKVLEQVVTLVCTSSLKFEKEATASRVARSQVEATDIMTGGSMLIDKGSDPLENTTYILFSEHKADTHALRNMARFLNKKGVCLISVSKSDVKLMERRNVLHLADYLKTLPVSEREMLLVFKNFDILYNEKYYVSLEDCFTNPIIKEYLEQHKKIASFRSDDTVDYTTLHHLHKAFQNRAEYKDILKIQQKGFNLLKDEFPLILSVDVKDLNKLNPELKVYIQAKEKGVKKNG